MLQKAPGTQLVISLFAALICSVAGPGVLQAQDTSKLTYDVSTVKEHDPADQGMSWGDQNGRFEAINVQLKSLIADAWGVRPDQVVGAPAWADDQHWDVTGKVTEIQEEALKKLSKEDRQRMAQALLVERFQAKVHLETRTGRVFNLVPAKDGVKLKVSQPVACDPKPGGSCMPPGSLLMHGAEGGGVEMTGHGLGMKMLISNIAMNLQQTVIDKTELPTSATYDFTLKFAPDMGPNTSKNGDAVPLREALQEQLGLRLEPTRGPVLTVVVDHVDKPKAN